MTDAAIVEEDVTSGSIDEAKSYYMMTMVRQASNEDVAGNETEAAELYMEVAQLCIDMRKDVKDAATKSKLWKTAKNSMERAVSLEHSVPKSPPAHSCFTPLSTGHLVARFVNYRQYTMENINVLRTTSNINGRLYFPFEDAKERFSFVAPFSDKDGRLALSSKQKEYFAGWVRPADFISDPKMIIAVPSFNVKQSLFSDCSFVASLAISAQYERRYNKRLITSIIYPQSKMGNPVYNPCGKYMIKLHINGVPRKVIIDDYLPMGKDGQLLCSFSSNKSELWVSMLEEAYMKVLGGYNSSGSNSNIVMHALTGWIPERVPLKSSVIAFEKDKEFRKILDKFHRGHCVVTVATGAMSQTDAGREGLAENYTYALLDIREALGKRVLMLKNPWSHSQGKERFSEYDADSWTPEMKKALNYEPKNAQQIDNEVFCVDYDSFCRYFECIYINWNPALFTHTTCFHHTWTARECFVKNMYNISDNPQYRLELKNNGSPAAVWILLTRQITDKVDFADCREFMTVFVYKGGQRVYYPYDPAPYMDGIKINSPHYLCKMLESGSKAFTLIISSQHEQLFTAMHYTLRVYAQCEFKLTEIKDPYMHIKEVTGEWKGKTAGGCANYPSTNILNPIYQVQLDNSAANNALLVEIDAPRIYSVGLTAKPVDVRNPSALGNQQDFSSAGAYRKGYCILRLDSISGGVYNIIPSTFSPGEEGAFFLKFSSSTPMSISKLQ